MKLLSNPYFFIPVLMITAVLLFLFYRWKKCKDKNRCVTEPCTQPCSFWTGKITVPKTQICSDGSVIPVSEVCPKSEPGHPPITAGIVDLWCTDGKYYKRTTTTVYGQPTMLEITRQEFDVLVSQGISYSGCSVGEGGIITNP